MKPFDFLQAAASGLTPGLMSPVGSTLSKKEQKKRKNKNTRAKLSRRKNRGK